MPISQMQKQRWLSEVSDFHKVTQRVSGFTASVLSLVKLLELGSTKMMEKGMEKKKSSGDL